MEITVMNLSPYRYTYIQYMHMHICTEHNNQGFGFPNDFLNYTQDMPVVVVVGVVTPLTGAAWQILQGTS